MAEALKLTCTTCGQTNRVPADRLGSGPKCGSCGDPLANGKVAELDPAIFAKIIRDDVPVLVDFWAPWCGPCRTMAPQFAQAAKALAPSVRLAKLNTQDHPEASARQKIRGIPALILYQRGRELGRLTGARPAAEIEAFTRSHAPAMTRGTA